MWLPVGERDGVGVCGYGVRCSVRWLALAGVPRRVNRCLVSSFFRGRMDVRAHPVPYRTALADDERSSVASVVFSSAIAPRRAPLID